MDLKNRCVVVDTTYHQNGRNQPTAVESTFSLDLATDEHPYQVPMTVAEEWQAVDLGWLDRCSMLVLKNLEGVFTQIIPTEEERRDALAKVVDVSFDPPRFGVDKTIHAYVPATASTRMWPSGPVHLRCQSGEARIVVFAMPE